MSYFYTEISYSSTEDDSKIENLISPLLQKYDGSRYLGVGKVSTNSILQSNVKYRFSKEEQRNEFIQAVNMLDNGIFAQTFL
jgi:hypothetical protein